LPQDTETLDRVVAAIANVAITESDVLQEYRFETFAAEGRVPTKPPAEALFRTVESRLIDQELLERQLHDYPADVETIREKAAKEMNTIRKRFKNANAFNAALTSLGMTEAQVLARLETEQHISMMIDERTRPAAAVEPQEILQYYRKNLLPQLAKSTTEKLPPLAQVQDRIREILVQQKINQLLASWLAELRREQHVRVFGS
jgi:peptidyl-prolyl cis-trans isomerase SurA